MICPFLNNFNSREFNMWANCRDKRNYVDKHNINAESNIFVVFKDIFGHDQIINHHWFRPSPGHFFFQSKDIFSINFVSVGDIARGHWTVQDEILGYDVLEVSRRRVSNLCIKVSSLFSVLYLTLAVSFFVFLHCLHQCYLTISSIVVMQTILVHYEVKQLAWFVHCEYAIGRTIVCHLIFLFRIFQTKDVGDSAFVEPCITIIF